MQLGDLVAALRIRYQRLLGRDLRSQVSSKAKQSLGEITIVESDGTRRVKLDHSDPHSRQVYREIQEIGNRSKINAVFAKEANLEYLAQYAERTVGRISFVLCHGTRNGTEQSWFKKYLSGNPHVLGTEISSTAAQFPDTIQWDFHDPNPEWIGKADIIYSNSWDHSIDPERMFRNWMQCLTQTGVMLIEHSTQHEGQQPDVLDTFAASRDGLVRLLERIGQGEYRVTEIIEYLPEPAGGRSVVVVRGL